MLVRLTVDAGGAEKLARSLMRDGGVLAKDASAKMADGWGYLRLAVRTAGDHAVLASALRSAADGL